MNWIKLLKVDLYFIVLVAINV